MMDFHRRRESEFLSAIPQKANRILHIVLLFLLAIAFRVWHLSVLQHEKRVDEAFRSRKRVIIDPSLRGTIRDRFNNVLAKNKTEYQLGIIYSQFNEVPLVATEKVNGEVKRRRLRREYIQALSSLIAKEIGEDKDRICDLIYSYAPFYGHAPFVIKRGLSESTYYHLKMVEKDWPGLHLIRTSKRSYPYGKTASHLLGYLGSIPQSQYQKLMMRVSELSEYIKNSEISFDDPDAIFNAKRELRDLKERFYTLNDAVGTMGVESSFEKDLRGYVGKRVVLSTPKGSVIRELPGSRSSLPGKRLMLTISVELQEHAEKLLALSEKDRSENGRLFPDFKEPWTKGGAIVAIEPMTGEVLALASYPRFDPNDFSSSNKACAWIENEQFFSDVWDQKIPLTREFFSDKKNLFLDDEKYLSWNDFLKFALPIGSPIIKSLDEKRPIKEFIKMQSAFDEILKLAPSYTPYEVVDSFFSNTSQEIALFGQNAISAKATLSHYFNNLETTKEKLFLLDLSRLALSHEYFSQSLFDKIGNTSLETFRNYSSSYAYIKEAIQKEAKKLFHENEFKEWRKNSEKAFLRKVREKETKKKVAHRPYLDYIDKEERRQFAQFIDKYQYLFSEYVIRKSTELVDKDERNSLLPYFDHFDNFFDRITVDAPSLLIKNGLISLRENISNLDPETLYSFFRSMKYSSQLLDPAFGSYRELVRDKNPTIKQIFMAVLRGESAGTMRSHGFRQSTIQGSIFKLVTAYAGLKQRYQETNGQLTKENASSLEIVDKTYKIDGKTFVGTFLDGRKIPQHFKGGRIPKSLSQSIGKVDIIRALETSSNPYFSLLASEILNDPDQLIEAAKDFGYGEISGISIPGELKGEVPSDVKYNKTGLYATAIGQHTLVTTPLQTALMISAIANKGMLLTPKISSLIAGRRLPSEEEYAESSKQFTDVDRNEVIKFSSPIRRSIFLPDSIRKILLEGMRCSTMRAYDDANSLAIRYSQQHPQMYKDFMKMKGQIVGKSSTSEVIERMGVNFGNPASMYRHIWFGGISFNHNSKSDDHPFVFTDPLGQPELVVVVYLRYAGYGKEAAPLAASVAAKWKEIVGRTKAIQ